MNHNQLCLVYAGRLDISVFIYLLCLLIMVSTSLLKFFISKCKLFTFSAGSRNILIIIRICDNSEISFHSQLGYVYYFISDSDVFLASLSHILIKYQVDL